MKKIEWMQESGSRENPKEATVVLAAMFKIEFSRAGFDLSALNKLFSFRRKLDLLDGEEIVGR
jgi:hypothetical protein